MLTTFFDGEIISKKYPFLTRKWDADEDVDRKHWVSITCHLTQMNFVRTFLRYLLQTFRANFQHLKTNTKKHSIQTTLIMTA